MKLDRMLTCPTTLPLSMAKWKLELSTLVKIRTIGFLDDTVNVARKQQNMEDTSGTKRKNVRVKQSQAQ